MTEVIDFNPPRPIKRGGIAPFVDMAALPEHQRDIVNVAEREFTGGGSRFQNGDTLFARITPCLENGKTAKVNALPVGAIAHGSTEFIVMAAKAPEYDEDYVYYLARHPEFRAFAEARMEGTSGRQRVSWQALSEFSFAFPSPNHRKTIGAFLRKFDDKIDLNRRINQTLEAMAQAIFKSWFIDFDPVKAKIAAKQGGRDPQRAAMSAISGKLEAELDTLPPEQYAQLAATAALFPDEMEASELGEIPRGWSTSKVETLLARLSVKTRYTKDQVVEYGLIPVFEQGASILLGYHNGTASYQASAENPMFIFGDHTCVTRLSCQLFDISQNVIPLQGQDRATAWVYYAVKEKQKFQEYRRHWMELISKDVVVAAADTCLEFSKRVSNLHLQMEANERQMQCLRELRDTLLPKLLSGELSVTEAVAEVEA
ncbi:MAG: restriction endonuclease subunit S [Polaromonas sp.]